MTVSVTGCEVLVRNVSSPRYWAVIELVPSGRLPVVRVATPLVFTVPVPRRSRPLKNWTVPVGVPWPGVDPVTVAVSVIGWPKTDEVGTAVSNVVDDVDAVVFWVTGAEALPANVGDPS